VLLLQNISTDSLFLKISFISSCHDFALHSGDEAATYTSTPIALLVSIKVSVFLFLVSMYEADGTNIPPYLLQAVSSLFL
jgi:hypothetical protein